MSMFGRAAASFGAGVSSLAQRYMNEEDAANRAKLLADLQVQTHQRIDDYDTSDARQEKLRGQEAARIAATTTAKAGAERAAAVAAGNDAPYQSAQDAAAARDAERKARGEVAGGMITAPYQREKAAADTVSAAATARDVAKANAADTDYLKAQTAIVLADPRAAAQIAASRAAAVASYASAGSSNAHAEGARAQTEGTKLANEDKKRLGGLYDNLTSTLYDESLTDEQRAKSMQKINTQIQAIKAKNGQGAQRDPELDTQTVVEKKMDAQGNETTTTRKEVRRAGQGGKADDSDPVKAAMDKARAERAAAAEKKPAGMMAGSPAAAAAPTQPPALGAIDQGIYADMQPLADEYRQAKAQLQAAGKSGDQATMQRATQALSAAAAALRREAENRLGNGAQRFLADVL